MQGQAVKKINLRIPLYILTAAVVVLLFFVFGAAKADAKTITIKTPDQLKNINWKNAGFGPGNTYVIGNDMTLGEQDDSTCLLTKGKFVIDFNGHTVQNAYDGLTVFKVAGADVTMKDSKVSNSKPSVRSYGSGAVQITGGKLTINSGNYLGASTGQNNPAGLHVGGGTCVVNGGWYGGAYVGASCSGGNFYINGGTFQGGFPFALLNFGGNIKIANGKFIAGETNYGYKFPLGMYCYQQTYDFSSWFVSGANVTNFNTAYWNMQSQASLQPFLGSTEAVTYLGDSNTLTVSTTGITPPKTALTSISSKGKTLTLSWKKTARTSGYYVQFSTNPKFTSGVKTVKLTSASKNKTSYAGLKANTVCYYRIRSYRNFNGKAYLSGWITGGYNPTAPTITTAKAASNGIRLGWNKPRGTSVYRIYRKAGSGRWAKLADVSANAYVDRTAKKGVTYRYFVRSLSKNKKAFTTNASAVKAVKR